MGADGTGADGGHSRAGEDDGAGASRGAGEGAAAGDAAPAGGTTTLTVSPGGEVTGIVAPPAATSEHGGEGATAPVRAASKVAPRGTLVRAEGPGAGLRWSTDPRYPAMFRADGGARLVWDGTGFRIIDTGGAAATRIDLGTLRRLDVIVDPGRARARVAFTLTTPRAGVPSGHHEAASTTSHVALDVVEPSLERFRRFAEALRTDHPQVVSVADTPPPPSQREHRVRRTTTRLGVFARGIWSRRSRTDPQGPDVVDRLERLVALHRAGDLTAAEFTAAKAAVLGA